MGVTMHSSKVQTIGLHYQHSTIRGTLILMFQSMGIFERNYRTFLYEGR